MLGADLSEEDSDIEDQVSCWESDSPWKAMGNCEMLREGGGTGWKEDGGQQHKKRREGAKGRRRI